MTTSFLKKALTLFSSLSLVALFLLYRVGTFDNLSLINHTSLQTSHNGGNINPSAIDTTKYKKDGTKPLMLSSSKSLILTEEKPAFVNSPKKKTFTYKYPKSETEILSSSKSLIIFKPQKSFEPRVDSFKSKYDTLKNKQ